jgi:hypothetical protein
MTPCFDRRGGALRAEHFEPFSKCSRCAPQCAPSEFPFRRSGMLEAEHFGALLLLKSNDIPALRARGNGVSTNGGSKCNPLRACRKAVRL